MWENGLNGGLLPLSGCGMTCRVQLLPLEYSGVLMFTDYFLLSLSHPPTSLPP